MHPITRFIGLQQTQFAFWTVGDSRPPQITMLLRFMSLDTGLGVKHA